MDVDISELIRKGGVYDNIEGSTPEEVYKNISCHNPCPRMPYTKHSASGND